MAKFIDRTGNKYGRLTVIQRTPNASRSRTRFQCICDCGTTIITDSSSLQSGRATSCGCGRSLPKGEASFKALFRYTKCNAKYRNLEFSLSIEFFGWITKQPCNYCGILPNQVYFPSKRTNGEYIYNGIDRVDNDRGYIENNCVPCCGFCNYKKSATSVEDFREWIIQVYQYWASQ